MENRIEIPKHTLQVLLLEAFRYCLGRQTYAVSDCADNLVWYWDELSSHYQVLIHREIRHAIDTNSAGAECDIEQWRKILKLKRKDERRPTYDELKALVEESRQKAYNWEHDIEELLLTINALWKEYNHILEGK